MNPICLNFKSSPAKAKLFMQNVLYSSAHFVQMELSTKELPQNMSFKFALRYTSTDNEKVNVWT